MKPKIIYFDARGRAEVFRLIFEDNQVEYDDKRVAIAEWPQLKSSLLFGQLPLLEEDGVQINQTNAIIRHLARKYNLYGKNEKEHLRCDMVQEAFVDAGGSLSAFFWDPQFAAKRDTYEKETLIPNLDKLQALLNQNKTNEKNGQRHWVGSDNTFVDYVAWFYLDTVRPFAPQSLAKYQDLVEFKQQFEARPRIAAYLISSRRPAIYTAPMASFGGTPETS